MDTARISDLWQSTVDGVLQNRSTAIGVAAAAGVVTLTGVYFLSRSRRRKDLPTPPRATEIAAGGFKRNEVRNAFVDYRYGRLSTLPNVKDRHRCSPATPSQRPASVSARRIRPHLSSIHSTISLPISMNGAGERAFISRYPCQENRNRPQRRPTSHVLQRSVNCALE